MNTRITYKVHDEKNYDLSKRRWYSETQLKHPSEDQVPTSKTNKGDIGFLSSKQILRKIIISTFLLILGAVSSYVLAIIRPDLWNQIYFIIKAVLSL